MQTNNKMLFVKITGKYNRESLTQIRHWKNLHVLGSLMCLSVVMLRRDHQSSNIPISDCMYTTQCMSSPAFFVFLVAVFYLSHTLFLWSVVSFTRFIPSIWYVLLSFSMLVWASGYISPVFNFTRWLNHFTHQLPNLLSPLPFPVYQKCPRLLHLYSLSHLWSQTNIRSFSCSWQLMLLISPALSSAGSWWRLCETRCWKWCRWQGSRRCWGIPARWRRCTVKARYSSCCSGPSARGSGRKVASRWWTHLGNRDRKWIREWVVLSTTCMWHKLFRDIINIPGNLQAFEICTESGKLLKQYIDRELH